MITGCKLTLIVLVAMSAALTACATEQSDSSAAKRANPIEPCVFFNALYDWQALDESNLVVWVPGKNEAYRLALTLPLPGLKLAPSIGFVDGTQDGRLCSYGGDAITLTDAGNASRQPVSRIRSIELLNPDSLAQLEQQYKVKLTRESRRKALPKTPDRALSQ